MKSFLSVDRTNEANKGTNAKETESAKKTAVKVDPPKPSPSDNGDDDDDVSDDNDDGDGTPRYPLLLFIHIAKLSIWDI